MPIPAPFSFKLTSLRLSFSFLRWSLKILHTLDNYGLHFESHITKYFNDFFFLHLWQLWRLWLSTMSHGSAILLSSSLSHKYWYVHSKAFYLFSHISKLHSRHNFANCTPLFIFNRFSSDSSLMILHVVHFWGIYFFIPLNLQRGITLWTEKMSKGNFPKSLLSYFCLCHQGTIVYLRKYLWCIDSMYKSSDKVFFTVCITQHQIS